MGSPGLGQKVMGWAAGGEVRAWKVGSSASGEGERERACGHAAQPDLSSPGAAVTPRTPGEVLFKKYSSHLTHRQMDICIIYSRLGTLIGHTFTDGQTENSPKFE